MTTISLPPLLAYTRKGQTLIDLRSLLSYLQQIADSLDAAGNGVAAHAIREVRRGLLEQVAA